MIKKATLLFLLSILLISWKGDVKSDYPKDYFRSPVDFKILLAGSFGEIRKNHFHSGIDIRTESVTGKPVHAAADGYISRINISCTGFGKALYINHPNGYTSVYGHLERFNGAIGNWIRAKQYKQESFEMDVQLQPGDLPVRKGEIVAYSGNSGASGGPHLHFELRDAATQDAINPLLFGLPVEDKIKPRIFSIKIYPFGENSMVNNGNRPILLPVHGSDGSFSLQSKDTIHVSGKIIFGIQAYDFMDDSELKYGIGRISLMVDTTKYFEQHVERFPFADTRYVNSLVDYAAFIRSGEKTERSYIAPNNHLKIFGKVPGNGIVSFNDNKVHKVEYIVSDVLNNTAKCTFLVRSHLPPPAGRRHEQKPEGTLFPCKSENKFTKSDLIFELPDDALYEDLDFHYLSTGPVKGGYSPVHHLEDEYTPIQSLCTLSIKPTSLPLRLQSKAIIAKVDKNGRLAGKGGKWENGFVKTQIREFGDYTVAVDTTAPVIRAINIAPGKKVTKQHTISMKISDNLSGIKSYRGTLNGKWILMDFDAKSSSLIYVFDDRMMAGKNEFRLVVRDGAGNESVYKATLHK